MLQQIATKFGIALSDEEFQQFCKQRRAKRHKLHK